MPSLVLGHQSLYPNAYRFNLPVGQVRVLSIAVKAVRAELQGADSQERLG